MLADQLDEAVADTTLGIALAVSLEVAQIADMAFTVARGAVGLAVGVVYSSSISFCSFLSLFSAGRWVRQEDVIRGG